MGINLELRPSCTCLSVPTSPRNGVGAQKVYTFVILILFPFFFQIHFLFLFFFFFLPFLSFKKSQTDLHRFFPVKQPSALWAEKAMALHSSTLAWKIPWTVEPGGLQSMGSLRVGHDRATSLCLFTFMPWRRKWQPTPVFLPRESQGWGSLVGCRLWGHTESDTTEVT